MRCFGLQDGYRERGYRRRSSSHGLKESCLFNHQREQVVNLNVPALKAAGKVIGTSVAISAVFGLARYFRQNPRQLVIAPGWADGGLALWAKKLAKSGAKVAIWEQTHVSAMKSQGGNLYRQLAPQIVKLSYRHADVVAACSSAVADDIAKLSKLPVNEFMSFTIQLTLILRRKHKSPLTTFGSTSPKSLSS